MSRVEEEEGGGGGRRGKEEEEEEEEEEEDEEERRRREGTQERGRFTVQYKSNILNSLFLTLDMIYASKDRL